MELEARIANVRQRIAKAARMAGREPESVKLVAVSKTQPVEVLDEALAAGVMRLGENKVQEAERKLPLLTHTLPEFHFIGHLQSNKVNKLMPLRPTLIHSIDRISVAEKVNAWCMAHSVMQDILVQVNTSGEDSKSGAAPKDTLALCQRLRELPQLRVRGLMTIGALGGDETTTRACFQRLATLREELQHAGFVDVIELSMGMTGDFELAIAEGATIVRVGSAIFGARNYT